MQTGSESLEQKDVAPTPATTRETPNPTRLSATAPGQLRVIKRNGTVVPFEDSKITVAITKAFLAVEGGTAAASSRIHEMVADLTVKVVETFERRMPSGGTLHIEDIQDQVELALMRGGEQRLRATTLSTERHEPGARSQRSALPRVSGSGERD